MEKIAYIVKFEDNTYLTAKYEENSKNKDFVLEVGFGYNRNPYFAWFYDNYETALNDATRVIEISGEKFEILKATLKFEELEKVQ